MNRDRFDKLIDEAADRLNTPVDVPRDRMWQRIEAARKSHHRANGSAPETEITPDIHRHSWTTTAVRWWPAAAAALLILGFGLGRVNWRDGSTTPVDVPVGRHIDIAAAGTEPGDAPSIDDAATARAANARTNWSAATNRMFLRAESLLAAFEGSDTTVPIADPIPRWAGLLLYETRVLMDAPAAEDPELITLLGDLELVLAQIVRLEKRDEPADPSPELTEPSYAGSRFGNDGYDKDTDRAWIADGLAKRATLQRLRQHTQVGAIQKSL